MSDSGLPPNILAAVEAMRVDSRVLELTLDAKVAAIESHLQDATTHGVERAADLGAELRVAAHLLRTVPEIKTLVFPRDDPPDIAVNHAGREVSIEVVRLAVRSSGDTSDDAFVNAEEFSAALLAACSEDRSDWYVWDQVRRKLRKTASRNRTANLLVLLSDSPTVKTTLIGSVGAWRAIAGAAIDGEPVSFGDCVVWYDGPMLNETPLQFGANRSLQTLSSRALIAKSFVGIGRHFIAGPGDLDWCRELARRELYHMWECEDRGRRRRGWAT